MRFNTIKKELFKSEGVLWQITVNQQTFNENIHRPLCNNQTCHTVLTLKTNTELYCSNCHKIYKLTKDFELVRQEVHLKYEGFKTLDHPIYSLDLPPTKVSDEDNEDENYWVEARIVEKDGKKYAIVYFGEKIKNQTKKDYSQFFIDLEDEQIRFDKNNKNPMELLAKLIAEFKQSKFIIQSKKT